MTPTNLQELLDASGNTVELLRNSQIGAYIYPVVPYEFTNWRREQRAWRETAVLFDQTHHMANLFMRGPGAIKLISDTGINSVENFPVNMAKQFVPCTPAGHVIGDGILFHLDDEEYVWVGRAPVANWLAYQAEKGDYDVEIEKDDRSPSRPYGKAVTRAYWRFQIQGPNAWQVIEKVNGGPLEQLKFFRMAEMNVGGQRVRTLRHGMAGAPGLELWGPYEGYDEIRGTILEAGREFGMEPVRRARLRLQHAGVGVDPVAAARHLHRRGAARLPRVARRRQLRGHQRTGRELRLRRHRGLLRQPVGARLRPVRQVRPRLHRARRAAEIDADSQRHKVTLAWDGEDMAKIFASLFDVEGDSYQFFDLPIANYGSSNFDSVLDPDGKVIGCSMFSGYSANEKRALSLATINPNVEIGSEVTVVWGEPNGGSRKTTVQPHKQLHVRAVVSPVPYSVTARTEYAEGWRTAGVS